MKNIRQLFQLNTRKKKASPLQKNVSVLAFAILGIVVGVVLIKTLVTRSSAPKEVPSLRNYVSKTTEAPDGTMTTTFYQNPIHYKDEKGAFENIDARIKKSTTNGYEYENTTNVVKTYFKSTSDGEFIRLNVGDSTIYYALSDIPGIGSPKKVIAVASDTEIVYPNVYDGIDIVYVVDVSQNKIFFRINTKETAVKLSEIPLFIRSENARYQQDTSGQVFITNEKGTIARIASPFLAEQVSSKKNINISYTLDAKDNNAKLSKVIDEKAHAWLDDSTRTYPILVDPVTAFYPDANLTTALVDGSVGVSGIDIVYSDITAANGTDANYTDPSNVGPLLVASTTNNQFSRNSRGILLFDTSAIPADAKVGNVSLGIRVNDVKTGLGAPDLKVVGSDPASHSQLIPGDYNSLNTAVYGSVSYSSLSTTDYTDIALDTSAVETESITKLGLRDSWDVAGSFGGTWVSGERSGLTVSNAEEDGFEKDPKLVVTWSYINDGYWKFDEGNGTVAYDTSSNATNGTITEATWQTSDLCVSGSCLKFDGSNDTVTVTAAASLNLNGSAGYTMCTWIKPLSSGEGSAGEVFSKGSTYLRVDTESSGTVKVSALVDLATADATYSSTRTISTSNWSHLCATYTDDGDDEVELYINGQLDGTSTNGNGSPANDSANDLYIGGDSTNNFSGYIDDARTYPVGKTAGQIKTEYVRATTLRGSSAALGGSNNQGDPWSRGLVGYWKLDESTGNASDSSGKASTLTNVNTTAYTSGKYGNGADFESTSSNYEYAADNASLSLTGDVTVSAWIKPESVTASTLFDIAGKWDGANESYLLAQYGDEIRYYIDSSSNYVTTDSSNLATGSWYHITASYQSSSSSAKIYTNGVLQAATTSGSIPASIGDDAGRFQIGAEDSTTSAANFYDGVIDDVRVYNWAFGDREALALSEWLPDPTVYYDFNSTSSITDVAGGESNATISTASWYNASWLYRKKVIIDNTKVDADLTNFPVYFTETSDSDLAARAQSTGNDILFTNTSGTKLDHELLSYTSATGAIEAWVEVDAVANSADTVIYMYYGNSGAAAQQSVNATWGNSYAGVWHLEEVSGNVSDSTSNGFTGTNANTTTVTGKVGAGRDFNGTTAEIDYGTLSGVDFSTSYTVETWVDFDAMGDAASNCGDLRAAVWSKETSTSKILTMQEKGSSAYARHSNNAGTTTYQAVSGSVGAGGGWYHLVQVHDNTANFIYIYKNGALIDSTSTSTDAMLNPSANSFIQGNLRLNCNHGYVDGQMDELRISTTNRSTEWLSTEYNNQNSPSTFYSVGLQTSSTAYTLNSVPGKYGLARNIEKDYTDYFYVADNTELSIMGSMTMSAWIKPATLTAATTYSIAGKWDGGGTNQSYLLALYGDEVKFYVDSVSNTETTNAANLAVGTWYHVAAVYNSVAQAVTIYVNGVPQASTTAGTIPASIADDAGRFQIGAVDTSTSASLNYLYDGDVDELRIYPFILSSKQIVSVMNASHPSVGSPVGSAAAHYKFDEGYGSTANDESVNNNDGTVTNATWTNSGKFDHALSFDGNGDYVTVTNDDSIDFAANEDFTLSAWVKTSQAAALNTWPMILNKEYDTAGTRQGYSLTLHNSNGNSGQWYLALIQNGSFYNVFGRSDIADGNWHHIVGIRSGSTMYTYEDGRIASTNTSGTSATLSRAVDLRIGAMSGASPSEYYNGVVDEVKIYDYALTSEEVKLDYNRGKAINLGGQNTTSGTAIPDNSYDREYCVPGDSATCNAPVMHLKIDENTGTTTTYDISANSNDGTLTGITADEWKPGKKGSGLYLDGSGDYITVADNSSINFGSSQDFTVSMWVKTKQGGTAGIWPAILNKEFNSTGTRQGYSFWLHNENINLEWYFQIWVAGSAYAVFGDNDIADGNWHHIVGVRSGSSVYAYEDGIYSGSGAGSTGDTTRAVVLRIGALGGDGAATGQFPVTVDDVRIYNYARTAAQVSWEYNNGKPVVHYKLDECSGTVANDSSGNSLTGTITIGATGTNTSAGSCSGAAAQAWFDGSSGKYNSSVEFDDTDDYITVSDNTKLDLNSNITLSAWVKTAANEADNVIVSKGTSYEMGIIANGSVYWDGAGAQADDASARVLSGTWHHVVITNNDTTATYYVDGVLTGTDAAGIDTDNATALYIGYDGTNFFDGQIDDVRIYNYPLTAVQVKTLYNENSAVRFGPASGSP